MDKNTIINFFNDFSSTWDDNLIINEGKINRILDVADIRENASVLDVACGTGVLIPFYLSRGVNFITGIDISPKMIEIAKNKFSSYDNAEFICADADIVKFNKTYDSCMIFNAFPHFINPEKLLVNLLFAVKDGGTFTVAHDMGRKMLDAHHSSCADSVSCGLMHEDELEELFKSVGLRNILKIADDDIYIVSGVK